ncbi:MAG: TldD/PmbA family protein [candidate division NC10 bacterium]|nr:TldD/PmbA family protein [candidate division NC10 bacterium]
MIGEAKALETLEKVLKASEADQTSALLLGSTRGVTRFAESMIHQSMAESNTEVLLTAVLGKKIGSASTNSFRVGDLKKTLQRAVDMAKVQKENPSFLSLPGKQEIAKPLTFFPETAKVSPKERAKAVKTLFHKASICKVKLAGLFATGEGEVAVVNSLGVRAYQPYTFAEVKVIALSADSSGFAYSLSRDTQKIDPEVLGERAIKKCLESKNPRDLPPGRYDVILEPPAVGELLEWLSYIGLGAKSLQEGTSFMTGRLGEKVTGEQVTIYDDGLDPEGIAIPFDFEGVAKRRVVLIEQGVAKGVVYGSLTAAKEGRESTGHGLPPGTGGGPLSLNLFMEAGNVPPDELPSRMERGILVTRLHYVNGFLDTRRTLMTGMTRDGVFYVQEGKIAFPVKNLRFTERVLEAFSRIQAISTERQAIGAAWSELGATVVPALLIRDFNFTGETMF